MDIENKSSPLRPSPTESSTDALALIQNDAAAWDQKNTYVKPGFSGLLQSPKVALYTSVTLLGWFAYGYDQGVISSILVLPQFSTSFPKIAEGAPNSGFWLGLMTSSIELGAVVGSFLQGWMADRYSRKYTLAISAIIFTVGNVMQTAAFSYAVLVVGRTVTGIGMGM